MAGNVPRLHADVRVVEDADELYDEVGRHLLRNAVESVKQRGVWHVALSGGRTPEPFYFRLMTDPPYRLLPWKLTHIWLVDERCVPEDDEQSNFRLVCEMVADHIPTPRRNVHAVPTRGVDPARMYESDLRRTFGAADERVEPVRLDFVLLGMGADGHTASLFPGSAALTERRRWVVANAGPTVTPPPRVTMTYPLLNAARDLAVLVTGADKAPAIARVERQLATAGRDPHCLPISGIDPSPLGGGLTWFLDGAAAGR